MNDHINIETLGLKLKTWDLDFIKSNECLSAVYVTLHYFRSLLIHLHNDSFIHISLEQKLKLRQKGWYFILSSLLCVKITTVIVNFSKLPTRHLLVQSQQSKQQKNVWKPFKSINNRNNRRMCESRLKVTIRA